MLNWFNGNGQPTQGGDDLGKSIAVDNEGNILVTGQYNDIAFFEDTILQTPNYNPGIFISKLNSSGSLIWLIDDYSLNTAYSSSIVCDDDNNVFVIGDFTGTIQIDTFYLEGDDSFDSFILKMNPFGKIQRFNIVYGTNTVFCMSIEPDNIGNIYIAGLFLDTLSIDSFQLVSIGYFDIFVIKIDNYGNANWAKSYGGLAGDGTRSLSVDNANEVLITGNFNGSLFFEDTTINNYGGSDAFVAKLST
ncbi:MAG: hypothetical protein HY738_15785, partial [Bacteroidia bacterium]|nr:hypothetical protein [Bacteroidia bacterium]